MPSVDFRGREQGPRAGAAGRHLDDGGVQAMSTPQEHLGLTGDFLRGYLECALWLGTDESDDSGGSPLDQTYSISDFDLSSVQEAARECAKFEQENADDLDAFYAVWPKSPDGNSKEAFA